MLTRSWPFRFCGRQVGGKREGRPDRVPLPGDPLADAGDPVFGAGVGGEEVGAVAAGLAGEPPEEVAAAAGMAEAGLEQVHGKGVGRRLLTPGVAGEEGEGLELWQPS